MQTPLSTPQNLYTVICRISPDGSLVWMTAIQFQPNLRSLSIDASEQTVYFAKLGGNLTVIRIRASDGTILGEQNL